MPFLRSGHDGTFPSPILILSLFPSRRSFGLLTLISLSAASSASAKPFKAVGVEAWTSGSQTFIRARPGATVPPVAKVGRHTPLHVWGKYNGWYRVETHDHIFGWVFNKYLNSPGLQKVREMPGSKARIASNRTANQTMYGTPELLKKHFVKYGASGALIGLKKQGVYLAVAPKPASKARTVVASASKPVLKSERTRVASAPRLREQNGATPRRVERISAVAAAPVPNAASPVPVIESPRRVETPRRVEYRVPRPSAVDSVEMVAAPSPQRAVEVGKIAAASRDLMPSARLFARAAEAASQTSALAPRDSASPPATSTTAVAVSPRQPVVVPAPRAVVKPRVVAKPKVVKKAGKAVAKAPKRSRYSSLKARRREQLRARMGLSPAPMPPTVIAPVSPSELLKARQEYLSERKARLNPPAAQASSSPMNAPQVDSPGTAVGNIAPLPAPTDSLGGSEGSYLPPTPPALQPMAFEAESDLSLPPLYPILAHPTVVALSQIKPKAPLFVPTPLISLMPTNAPRGGSPRGGAIRGGSPRDRFGSGMASQALSYRGMPYIRGAASPSRGFDCSGLVYFLLHQRGYNPPRTAAGYRSWGESVSRGQLQPGDLLLFANTYKRGISHIGVYLGQNKFVHAATSGTGVRVSSLAERYYAGKYFGARRAKMAS